MIGAIDAGCYLGIRKGLVYLIVGEKSLAVLAGSFYNSRSGCFMRECFHMQQRNCERSGPGAGCLPQDIFSQPRADIQDGTGLEDASCMRRI